MTFVLDHCGVPDIAGGAFEPWARGIDRIAALPNVSVKLSGITAYAAPDQQNRAGLQRWVDQYVTADDSASQETKAQFPLREASVEVAEVPGRPGVYRAVSFIRPHFQLDELSVSLRLVAELPQGNKA